MRIPSFMVIAGEASGDCLAAELVTALRDEFRSGAPPGQNLQPLRSTFAPRFFGAGGPRMRAAGVELSFDLTVHSVIGVTDVLKRYFAFRRLFKRLLRLALDRQPDVLVCVDFSGFNRRFARAVRARASRKKQTSSGKDWFFNWRPKIVQFVSPQVWASRESRVYQIARDYDLLLSIFPFEKDWYAKRVPEFKVEFVGHPILDRYSYFVAPPKREMTDESPSLLLLPGSREAELRRHLPVLIGSLAMIRASYPDLRARMVLPNALLAQQARAHGLPSHLEVRVGSVAESLMEADLAIASTGTVTMECAYFRVPTVALYKTSWIEFQMAKRIVTVEHLAMPNLLADEELFPEFLQQDATADKISGAAIHLLKNPDRRRQVQSRLHGIIESLGSPGAALRAARLIKSLWGQP